MSVTGTEISSQPAIWSRALTDVDKARPFFGLPGENVLFLGCGTSAFVAEALAVLRERAGHGRTDWALASEWETSRHYDRVVAITRSGTSSEVLDALRLVPSDTITCAITGVPHEEVHDLVTDALVLDYADEESVVQTRFPTTVLLLGRAVFGEDVSSLPAQAARLLEQDLPFDAANFDHFVYLGAGWLHALAQESALKVREAAQAWSESYYLLDYRHGPIAVAHPGSLVWIYGAANDKQIADIEATGATVMHSADDPLVQLAQTQRIAVRLAESRGIDPDHPRFLSRSVVLDPAG